MKRVALVAVLLACLPVGIILGAEPASQPANLSVVLEKAVYAEETAGDLDTAGKLYRQVIDAAGANRPLAAQALQRLAMLQIKQGKPSEAQATVARIKADYAEQKDIIAKADEQLTKARAALPAEVVRRIVDSSVDQIATLSERDPKLQSAVDELTGLPAKPTVERLTERLDSEVAEQRQAALYLLWKAQIDTIQDAVPKLTALLSHDSDITRGMTAIVLGGRKIADCYQALADMALKDSSSYARRCAVYALGELGDPRGLAVAQQALKDSDTYVKANAKWAVEKLKGSESKPSANGAPSAADKRAAEQLSATGWRLWGQRKLAEAEQQFKLAVEKDPTNANNWNGLGWSQFNQGMKESARASFEKAIELDPKAAASWNGLGWIAKNEGQTDDAIKYWLRSVEAAPSATAALSGLAQTYQEKGDYSNAEKYYKQWLQYEPNNPEAIKGRGKLTAARQDTETVDATVQAETVSKDLDEGNYDAAWEKWHDEARINLFRTKENFPASMQQYRRAWGKPVARELLSTNNPVSNDPAAIIQYATEFDSGKFAVEVYRAEKNGIGRMRVSGYGIFPAPVEPAKPEIKKKFEDFKVKRQAMGKASAATDTMLKDLDAGRYGEAWDQWADFAKKQLGRKQFESSVSAVLKPMGKVLERKQISATYLTQIPGAPDGEYVVQQFKTQFENKKDAVETITPMKDKDGVWRVSGYFIK